MMTVNISVGYEWDQVTRSMGNAVISLRDGSFDDVIWITDLPIAPAASGSTVTPILPKGDSPPSPMIEVPGKDHQVQDGTRES